MLIPNLLMPSKSCQTCESRKDSIFCDLPAAALDILDRGKSFTLYKKGSAVFLSGTHPSGLFCVTSGVIRIETSGSKGKNHILRLVQSGGILGYRSLFAEEAYEASAMVHEEAHICHVPKSAIIELMKKFPEIALKFLSQVSKELKQTENRLCTLTDKTASERVAEALLFLKSDFKAQTWTRKEIAEWAGTTPETVMRTLSEFESEGIIALNSRSINILDYKALSEKADLVY